jgi:hypothetical protein
VSAVERTLAVTRITAADSTFQAALAWEFQVFGVTNGYASSADVAAGRMTWYARYDAASEFHVARDARGNLAGIARLIRHDARLGLESFSTIADASSYSAHGEPARAYLDPTWQAALRSLPPPSIAELATQSIMPRYRRFRAIDALWRSMIEAGRADGVELWTMALVVPLFRFYKSLLPNAIHAIGSVMPDYIGADSIPALLRLTHREVEAYLNGSDQEPKRGVQWL